MPHALPAVTCPVGKVSMISLAESAARIGVEVVKETVAVPVVPTAELMIKSVAALATMAPTAGMLTYAATVSLLVSIFRPVAAVAVTAALAARVRPVHVTVTGPAARLDVATKLIVIALNVNFEVTGVCDVVIPHRLSACAITEPIGKVIVILFAEDCCILLDVLKEMVAIPPRPAAVLMVKVAPDIAPTAPVETYAGMVSFDVSILNPRVVV